MLKKALCIDDSPTTRGYVSAILAHKGYEIVGAEDGLAGIENLKARCVDFNIIVLDLVMPKMSGFDVMDTLKLCNTCSNIPVIVISGEVEKYGMESILNRGAKAVLKKPFKPEELLAMVDRMN